MKYRHLLWFMLGVCVMLTVMCCCMTSTYKASKKQVQKRTDIIETNIADVQKEISEIEKQYEDELDSYQNTSNASVSRSASLLEGDKHNPAYINKKQQQLDEAYKNATDDEDAVTKHLKKQN